MKRGKDMNILTLNKISTIGTDEFGANYTVTDACDTPDAICKSGIVKDIFGVDLYYSADKKSYFYLLEVPQFPHR